MGWLFGKKKAPRVPLPLGRLMTEGSLSFPNKVPVEKVIQPERVKSAGLKKPQTFPSGEELSETVMPFSGLQPNLLSQPVVHSNLVKESLYIKMDVYQRILGEMESLKVNLSKLNRLTAELEKSEFNEEQNFDKLKGDVKVVHDRLMQADKILFKGD